MIKNYNRDIMQWSEFPPHDIVWCDPPWEQKMVNYFQTIMKRDCNLLADHTIFELISQLGKLSSPEKPVYIEYSVSGVDIVINIMNRHGHTLEFYHEAVQSNGNPYAILAFNTGIDPVVERGGFNIIVDTMKQYPGGTVVFDPFAGIGNSARAFRKAGCVYIGSEINPGRYARLCKSNP